MPIVSKNRVKPMGQGKHQSPVNVPVRTAPSRT